MCLPACYPGARLRTVKRFQLYKTTATWFCVALVVLVAFFDSTSSVACIHSDGSVQIERSDGSGHCISSSEYQLSTQNSSPSITESCLDLPLSGTTCVPSEMKRLSPVTNQWSVFSNDWLLLAHSTVAQLRGALSKNTEIMLVTLSGPAQMAFSGLKRMRGILLLV